MPVFHLITHFAGSTAPDDLFGAVTRWASFFVGSCFVAALVERRVEHPILEWRDRVIPR
jgi:peptidoglycan/LPS O-acetylase OafA/YrhL